MGRVSRHDNTHRHANAATRGDAGTHADSAHRWSMRVLPLGDAHLVLLRESQDAALHEMRVDDHHVIHLSLSDPRASTLCGEDLAAYWSDEGASLPDVHFDAGVDARWLSLHFREGRWLPHDMDEAACDEVEAGQSWRVLRVASAATGASLALVTQLFAGDTLGAGAVRHHAQASAARQVLESLVRAVHDNGARMRGRRPLDRQPVIARCLDLIEAQLAHPISIEDLCAAAGVSDRTLRTMFAEWFGVSPHRYLMNRRMQAIHEALCSAREGVTVTSVCSDYGVWDFGRFARQYRQLYGVLPSQDLRTPRRGAPVPVELMDLDSAWPSRAQFLRGVACLH